MAEKGGKGASELENLFEVILERAEKGGAQSYTRRLLDEGTPHLSRKLGEEAVELMVAALSQEKKEIVGESADLLYHWLLLMKSLDVAPSEVYAELKRRREEKTP